MHGANKNDFLERIVTGDETMVLYHDPTTKKESMEWRRPDENRPIKAKVAGSKKKIMASIFWDCEGILLIDSKEPNTTVNAAYYASLLHKLRDAIKEKRRGKLSKNILLLHDNAPVHKAQVAQAAIRECGFTEIDHPPYSPDLAPSDFFLFKNLKKELRGKKFQNDEDLKSAVIESIIVKKRITNRYPYSCKYVYIHLKVTHYVLMYNFSVPRFTQYFLMCIKVTVLIT